MVIVTLSAEFPITLSKEIVSSYERDGFVVTQGVLSEILIEKYGQAVDSEVNLRTARDTRPLSKKSLYEQSFIQCMRLWETSEAVRALSCDVALAGIATQLMGVQSVRLWQDQALYKESGGRETTPHQDQTFWPIGNEPLVSAWIPFEDVTIQDGAMAYVAGSHKAGRLKVVDITHSTDPYKILEDPALKGRSPEYVEVKAGSVVWHHGLTVHQAAANQSGSTRRVFTIVYIASNARRAKTWPTYPLDREGIEVGEEMRGDGMPILWPASSRLPEPPQLIGGETGPQ